MKAVLLALIIAFPVFGQEKVTPPEVAETIAAIEAYESIEGTWEGRYTTENGPRSLSGETVGIRIILKHEQKPQVLFLFPNDKEWTKTLDKVDFIPDSLGWHILISGDGGVFQERIFVTAARIEEKKVEIVVTRTVHNWYLPPDVDAQKRYYYVFGVGYLEKI